MSNKRQNEQPEGGGINLADIYYILFRQKWIVLASLILGIVAVGVLFVIKPAQYQSDAKLLIRYVVDKTLGPAENDVAMRSPEHGDTIITTEIEILTSLDLAQEVVRDIGADKILPPVKGAGTDTNGAAGLVLKNLVIDPLSKGSVIHVSYQHPDPVVAQTVMGEIIANYYKKHAQMHQAVGVFGDFLTAETKRLRTELDETDKLLRQAKSKAGVISLEDAKKAWADQMSKVRENIMDAEAELAEHRAALNLSMGSQSAPNVDKAGSTNTAIVEIPADRKRAYKNLCARLAQNQKQEENYLAHDYREDSPLVVQIRAQIDEEEKTKKKMEEEYPNLIASVIIPATTGQSASSGVDPATEGARVRMLEGKTNRLHLQLDQIRQEASNLEAVEGPIQELQRQKDLREATLRHFLSNLEQSRIDAELGAGKGSGEISIVESPTPPIRKRPKGFMKLVGGAFAGCVGGGLGLAFLIEMFLDHSVRRPTEIEKKLKLPVFISIPDVSEKNRKPARLANGKKPLLLKESNGHALVTTDGGAPGDADLAEIPPWDPDNALHRFYAGLRERLIVNFEVRNLTHNPKLVAVTSCGKGAGVSTIAAGLAASLSETGDGNVLLVNMNTEQHAAHQFYKGKPGCGLDDALEAETMNNAMVSDNLYVATEGGGDEKLPRVLPKRFASLMPKLKASDYDYIIFDMPPVSQTSTTPRLAGLMDMVLLVIESEKTSRDTVQKASALLAESKANVSTVLNKTKSYIPALLHQEFHNDA